MNPHQSHDDMLELAALYALGTLSRQQAVILKAHLEAGCPACQEALDAFEGVVGHLGSGAAAAHPPAAVRDRLLARIQSEAATEPRAWAIVRAEGGAWEATDIDGLWRKTLYRDGATQRRTALVRMQAETCYPAHRHADTEELYVLAGDLSVAGQELRAGDFCAAIAGSRHRATSTAAGCLFLLTASERDEVAEDEATDAPQPGLVLVRANDGLWRDGPAAGVAVKRLFFDRARRTTTALVRMEAGASLPPHRHVTTEQFYMLEGDGHVAGHVLQPGDYYRAAAGSSHDVTYTEGGCLFLLLDSHVAPLA